jgi:hypothetical protein
MSGGGGGGTTNTVSQPWSPAQPYLKKGLEATDAAFQAPPAYYPGQTFTGPTAGQIGAWGQQLGYADQVFGGQAAPKFGDATQTLSSVMQGGQGEYGQAGSLDARGAIQGMLTGTPDYAGAQGAIDAANAPILRQLQQDVIPGLNSRATFLNNGTGGIKTLNRVLPEVGQRMGENAQGIMNAERLRALETRNQAAGMVAQGGQNAQNNALTAANMLPGLAQFGMTPGALSQDFANWGAGFQDMAMQDQVNRWDYYQNLPRSNADWYNNAVRGSAGLGSQTQQQAPQGSKLAGVAGGALAGAAAGALSGGTVMGLPGAAFGGITGGLMGLLG